MGNGGVQAAGDVRKGGQVHINGKRPNRSEQSQYEDQVKAFGVGCSVHSLYKNCKGKLQTALRGYK